jgi:hypothetical protein
MENASALPSSVEMATGGDGGGGGRGGEGGGGGSGEGGGGGGEEGGLKRSRYSLAIVTDRMSSSSSADLEQEYWVYDAYGV